ncbi:hypothetical protein [Fibrobacter sp.]|uniref:hypothetical protein n=1 Tax=Fibrobacter sp. TaxID=35828 RepID=UPI0025BDF650|nr:hypothetical protein [Fibrobacter sp.]MCI6438487.1 hypothetical protein [Fibrobacter sp.]MDD7498985.1 hypothetical protein [Fibrobacter sp.]MDY5724215.1 hypothetical protein [Fibrobacter sp.]
MKKFIALFICVFIALLFEGCAPYAYTSQNDLPYNDEQIEPAPKPKAKPRPVVRKAKPAPRRPKVITKAVPKTVPKKVTDYDIVTDNMYPIPKSLNVDNDMTIVSLTPVAYTDKNHCNEVYFFNAIVTPTSGYHGLVDISMSESKIEGGYSCKYFGTAVIYQVKPNPFIKYTIKYEDIVRKYVPEQSE